MARIDFCGGSYSSQSVNFDAQRAVNWYPELNETGTGKSKMALYPAPGLLSVVTLPAPSRGSIEFNGLGYVIAGTGFFQIVPLTFDAFGQVLTAQATLLSGTTLLANDGNPASLDANENQILIASGGNVYVYYINAMNDSITQQPIAAGTFKQVPPSAFTLPSGPAPVLQVKFCDSFFLALLANSQSVQISNLLDGFNWLPGTVASQIVVSVFPDNVVGIFVDHRNLYLFGRKKTALYSSGDPVNIFGLQPGGFIEQGLAAAWSPVALDNSVFWIGQRSDTGGLIGWRANGYNVVRVTTHAVEFAWSKYTKVSDAVAYSYVDQGHAFWKILFPSANGGAGATWVYDAATGLWHERNAGQDLTGHPSWNHIYVHNTHLVGDWKTGAFSQMSINQMTVNGKPMNRIRTTPHVAKEKEMIRYDRFELDMEAGVGAVSGQGANPQIFLSYSDDGGHNFKNKQSRSFGALGNFQARVKWEQLGSSRNRVFKVECSEPVPVRIVDAYLAAAPGFQPQERLAHQLRKMA